MQVRTREVRSDVSGTHSQCEWNPTYPEQGRSHQAPPPAHLTELHSFLGAVQYCAKFVPNLSTVLHPLHDLLKAGVEWSWDSACDEAFNQCKRLLSSETVLTHYDESKPLVLATDASSYGVRAVISCQLGWKNPLHLHQEL